MGVSYTWIVLSSLKLGYFFIHVKIWYFLSYFVIVSWVCRKTFSSVLKHILNARTHTHTHKLTLLFLSFVQAGKGILRSVKCEFKAVADIVPVDIPVNLMITVGWYTALVKPASILIYHCTTGSVNPFTWGEMGKYADT